MSHNDKIKDCDAFFEVDPITRQIKNMTPAKIVLMQGDHNSEKFTFTLPRYIEGHDMAESAKAKLHYMNPAKSDVFGMYEMADLQVDEDNAEKVKCSWLISGNATKEAGAIAFLIEFECFDGEELVYSWHTAPFKGISIGETFGFEEEIAKQYADVLEQWKNDLEDKINANRTHYETEPEVLCDFSFTEGELKASGGGYILEFHIKGEIDLPGENAGNSSVLCTWSRHSNSYNETSEEGVVYGLQNEFIGIGSFGDGGYDKASGRVTFGLDEPTSGSIKLWKPGKVVPLPEKYIPDTIARTADVEEILDELHKYAKTLTGGES